MAAGVGAVMGLTVWASFSAASRLASRLFRLWERWITWQGASREQREQMRREGDDRFDWLPEHEGDTWRAR